MKSLTLLGSIIAVAILGGITPTVYAQNMNVLQSQNTTFTFSECVNRICVRKIKIFQESIEEFIPKHTEVKVGLSIRVCCLRF